MLEVIRALIIAAALAHPGVDPQQELGLARCESTYNQFAVNPSSGAAGLFQLLSPGELDAFYARGYTDKFDPSQQANFVAEELAAGRTSPWSQTVRCYGG